ncbi:MAG: iron-sulfur cluster assembly scaffold protein [Anaerolineaceae bacterium]|nr:iron-sulfur cluster assembly scaffold protein [Anaerolineaceae bacterium]
MEAFEKAMPVKSPSSNQMEKVLEKPNQWSVVGTLDDSKKPVIKTVKGEDGHDKAFSDVARQLIRRKENMGSFDEPDAMGKFTGWCEDTMQIQFHLDGETIKEARFLTDGCGATIACGSMLTKMVHSKTLEQAMKITPDELLAELISIPDDHEHCLSLAVTTLRKTIQDAWDRKNR